MTENILASGWRGFDDSLPYLAEIRPDLLIFAQLRKDRHYLPLEYEAHRKFNNRYEELVKRYYFYRESSVVLYIARNEDILSRVRKIEERFSKLEEPRFFYTTLKTFMSDSTLTFTNNSGLSIVLNHAQRLEKDKLQPPVASRLQAATSEKSRELSISL